MIAALRRRRARGDRGAVLIEAAFVLPVFLLFVFGTIEFGLYFAGSASTVSASRDGARFASANFGAAGGGQVAADAIRDVVVTDMHALTGQDTPVRMMIYRANANGYPDSRTDFDDCTTDCFKYTWNAATATFDSVSGPTVWSTPDACITLASPSLDPIGVFVEVDHRYITGVFSALFGSKSTMKEYTVSLLEPRPVSQC